jgi:hypothetical protein
MADNETPASDKIPQWKTTLFEGLAALVKDPMDRGVQVELVMMALLTHVVVGIKQSSNGTFKLKHLVGVVTKIWESTPTPKRMRS